MNVVVRKFQSGFIIFVVLIWFWLFGVPIAVGNETPKAKWGYIRVMDPYTNDGLCVLDVVWWDISLPPSLSPHYAGHIARWRTYSFFWVHSIFPHTFLKHTLYSFIGSVRYFLKKCHFFYMWISPKPRKCWRSFLPCVIFSLILIVIFVHFQGLGRVVPSPINCVTHDGFLLGHWSAWYWV